MPHKINNFLFTRLNLIILFRYLSARQKLGPETKFSYPLTYSMEYGWKISERIETKRSEFARKFIIKNSFFRPAGVIIGPT